MLAKSKIKRFKRKTLLMVAPMGLFFGVIMAMLLVFVSLEATAFREMDKIDKNTYLAVDDNTSNVDLLTQRAESVGGKIISGNYRTASTEGRFLAKNGSLLQVFLDARYLNYYPHEIIDKFVTEDYTQSEVPILTTLDEAATLVGVSYDANNENSFKDIYENVVGRNFVLDVCDNVFDENGMQLPVDEPGGLVCTDKINYKIVGIIPEFSPWSEKSVNFQNPGFFTGVLSGFSSHNGRYGYLLVSETEEFKNKYKAGAGNRADAIVQFGKYEDARRFKEEFACERLGGNCDFYYASEFFGNRFAVQDEVEFIAMLFGGAMVVMAVIAMIAFAVNVTKIIDDEAQLIDLYKIVGASRRDVTRIYAAYIAKVVFYTIIASVVVSLVISTIIFVANADTLLTGFSFMYSSSVTQVPVSSMQYAIDWNYVYVILGIIFAGLVGYAFSERKLRKMK
ncbi:MAG: ABC transporter permease [Candidatus Nanosyncoccaceae bacterium]